MLMAAGEGGARISEVADVHVRWPPAEPPDVDGEHGHVEPGLLHVLH
jgi:hypothetical protein